MQGRKKPDSSPMVAQRLNSTIKSCRNIMRKDKGISSDIERLPLLTGFMFLRFVDDKEKLLEAAATPSNPHSPWIEMPYRWRDWASEEDESGLKLHLLTGDDFIRFVHDERFTFPDGSEGPGLIQYLKGLRSDNGREQRDVIATIYSDFHYRMVSGHLLREMIVKLDGLDFTSTEEIHVLSHIYETMLKQMRDAAGQNGEFYTPRPVVKFMVKMINPRLGETVLDPACGTGGFLVEAFRHLYSQVKTTGEIDLLQHGSILGGEAKPLPFMLCQMNLLLHDFEYPNIDYGNSLRFKIHEIGDEERVDIILTNPPFGGEEERGIQDNFPKDRRTAETALLFLQLVMRKLKREGEGIVGGRCAIVVPNGTLFGDGVAARIKGDLLSSFNLHTIVRLPEGVFSPYADIETNLLFFERGKPTDTIWYYEVPLPPEREGRRFTKTKPIRSREFEPVEEWWFDRKDNKNAWRVRAGDIVEYDDEGNIITVNLDIKNPNAKRMPEHKPPEEIVESILRKEEEIMESMAEIRRELEGL